MRLHQPEPENNSQEPILFPAMIVSPIQWSVDEQITQVNRSETAPPRGPDGLLYIPPTFCLPLMDSYISGLPGSQRTLSLLRHHYWWPTMAQDISWYLKGCSVCVIINTSRRLPEGKLVPLPIPHCPWSHLGIDFMTDLPPSDNHTCVFVVVDHFSKACKLIPLKGLPTAFEAAEVLFQNVFRHFGLPEDIVSDHGPKFTSCVWQAFFKLLEVSVSLSSRYHPQTNSQTERKIQEIGRYLMSHCHQNQDYWSQFLP